MNALEDAVETVDAHEHLDIVFDWFGIEWASFQGLVLTSPNAKVLNLVHTGVEPCQRPEPVAIGIPFLRINMSYPKLTTTGVYFIGRHARRNVLDFDRERADAYLKRERVLLEPEDIAKCDERGGYVIIRCEGWTIGLGLLDTRSETLSVKSLQPKAWSIDDDATAFGR